MPEEIMNPEIVEKVVEKAAEAAVAMPKKIRPGKKAGLIVLTVTSAIALGAFIYTKVTGKDKKKDNDNTVTGEVVDNVKIAERDLLEPDEAEE